MAYKTPKEPQTARTAAARLTRDAWLDAAFKAAVEHGFDGVRVLVLADTLGVTRGSFYWHFKDHADLIAALLERWRAGEAAGNQQMQQPASNNPIEDLEILLDAALAHGGADLGNMRFELALRGLGRRDAAVAAMLLEVDQARMALFAGKFARIAPDAKTATDLAALFYLAIVGSFQALSRPQAAHPTKQYLQDIIGHFLVKQQAK
ncbi:MAG: TetR/AcrR family transcriptional regulator [Betaproteobacteria bacterium]